MPKTGKTLFTKQPRVAHTTDIHVQQLRRLEYVNEMNTGQWAEEDRNTGHGWNKYWEDVCDGERGRWHRCLQLITATRWSPAGRRRNSQDSATWSLGRWLVLWRSRCSGGCRPGAAHTRRPRRRSLPASRCRFPTASVSASAAGWTTAREHDVGTPSTRDRWPPEDVRTPAGRWCPRGTTDLETHPLLRCPATTIAENAYFRWPAAWRRDWRAVSAACRRPLSSWRSSAAPLCSPTWSCTVGELLRPTASRWESVGDRVPGSQDHRRRASRLAGTRCGVAVSASTSAADTRRMTTWNSRPTRRRVTASRQLTSMTWRHLHTD